MLCGWILHALKKKWGVRLLLCGTLVLLAGSFQILTLSSNRARTLQFEPVRDADLTSLGDAPPLIVVLGGGYNPDSWLPANSKINSEVMGRLVEGVRVLKQRPNAELMVSLSSDFGTAEQKRETLDQLAKLFEVNEKKLLLISDAQSTADEARSAFSVAGNERPVVVVTSAIHMPRSMKIFRSLEMKATAAPTNFPYPRQGSKGDRKLVHWLPSTDGINSTKRWLYENAATVFFSLTGR